MTGTRKPARTKRTATGKIMGRPVKRSGAELAPIEPEAPGLRRYCMRLRDPGYVLDPVSGEPIARRFGPGVPVFEWREPVTGRPPVKRETELLWIVRACRVEERGPEELPKLAQRVFEVARNEGATTVRKGRLVPAVGEGHSVAAVEQRLKRTLKEIENRRTDRTKAAKSCERVEFDNMPDDTET